MSEISSVSQSPQVDAGTATQRYLTETDQSLLGHIDANDTSSLVPMIQVSGVCNLKCTMCGGARELVPGKFMEPDLFMTVCDKLQADHVKSIIIAGAYGEPFLHPKIFWFLEHAKSVGINIILSTHGNNLDKPRIVRLALLDLMYIQFSFCGYDAETYGRIYKGGDFAGAVENIRELKKNLKDRGKTKFLVNGICDHEDYEMARRSRDLLSTLGVEDHEIQIRLPHNFGGMAPFEQMQEFQDIVSFKSVHNQHLSICKVMANTPGILWDGRITVCGCLDHKGRTELGNIKDLSLAEARKSKAFGRFVEAFRVGDIRGLPLCATCDVPYGPSDAPPLAY